MISLHHVTESWSDGDRPLQLSCLTTITLQNCHFIQFLSKIAAFAKLEPPWQLLKAPHGSSVESLPFTMLFTFGVVEISCQELPVSLLLSSTIVNLLNFSQKQAFFAIFANFKPPWKVLKAM